MNRQTVLAAVSVASVLGAIAYWYLTPTGITLSFNKIPLSQVLPVIEKKTKIKIVTDLDPSTPVTLMVHQSTPSVVWDALAGAVDARASVRIVLAPDSQAITTYRQALAGGQRPEGWESFRVPIPGMRQGGEEPADPRTQRLAAPSPWPDGPLHRHLQTLAESSDLTWTAPQSWNPPVAFSAESRTTALNAARELARRASGTMDAFLHLTSGFRGEGPPLTADSGGFRRFMPSPEVIERRIEQRIASLPPDQQASARQEWEKDRAFFQQMRDLPPEVRREKMQEYFNDPAVQERMEERAATRDERRSPERRRDRYREYIERRNQQQQSQSP